eukprot:1205297-Prorocentrum_lima.AAC.1
MTSSLVGSEMCIRDRVATVAGLRQFATSPGGADTQYKVLQAGVDIKVTVSYTHLTLPTICSV